MKVSVAGSTDQRGRNVAVERCVEVKQRQQNCRDSLCAIWSLGLYLASSRLTAVDWMLGNGPIYEWTLKVHMDTCSREDNVAKE